MIRRTALTVGAAIAILGGTVVAATPAAAHNGSCRTTARTITVVGRTVTGTESIQCDYQHRYWKIYGELYYRNALAGGGWQPGSWRYDDIDSGAGSTKRTHTYTLSATCDPVSGGIVQEWYFGPSWAVGEGDNPHYGGGQTTLTLFCV